MKEVFTYKLAVPCGDHEDLPIGTRGLLSCHCGLADAGGYVIVWDGHGLGFSCNTEQDAKRTVYRMNTAWDLAIDFMLLDKK